VAKKRSKKKSIAAPSVFSPPVVDVGQTVQVSIKSANQSEAVFSLSDGTVLHANILLTAIERSLEKFNPNGEPIYQITAGLMLKTVVPKKLKRSLAKP
jgi:hypothetical protein